MICIPIIAKNTDEATGKIARAGTLADMLEIRLDMMETFDLHEILKAARKPALVTYRSKKEGGKGSADDETRVRYLMKAVEAGADFVDVEYSLPLEFRQKLFQMRRSYSIILSIHIGNGTPSREKLDDIFRKMSATGADIVKIVTQAKALEDNLRVLELIPRAHDRGLKIIAFCMGPMGRISRVFSSLMGSYLTFASLEEGQESAMGQIPVGEMKKILEMLS